MNKPNTQVASRHHLLNKYGMKAFGMDSTADAQYIDGFNNALALADSHIESAIHALKRSFYEADAIAEGRNRNFVCAPVIRDYCKQALTDLGVDL